MAEKDYFSGHSQLYAKFRPTYPDELYRFIFGHLKSFDTAWDCATGNGQVAQVLSTQFDKVYATDISQQQLYHAIQTDNIIYSLQPAEKTTFPDKSIDLITVAQAFHWINTTEFYKEVRRIAKSEAWLAVWGYTNCTISPAINPYFLKFYSETVGAYWDEARKLVEDEYRNIPFPFEEIITPKFFIRAEWTVEQFAGYLTSWSATQKFIKKNGFNPVSEMMHEIAPLWGINKAVTFPLFLRIGKIHAS